MPELDLTGVEDIPFEQLFDGPIGQTNVDIVRAGLERSASNFAAHGSGDPRGEAVNRLVSVTNQFRQEFRNSVGRTARPDEIDQFFTGFVIPTQASAPPGALNSAVSEFTQRIAQPAAEAFAQEQLQSQTQEAQRLSDVFRQQGEESILGLEESLKSFQNDLLERVRPSLIQTLQTQGLLNTGGLNQALAGQQGDLARAAQEQLIQKRFENEQQANQIAFAGEAAPFQFQQAQTLGRLPAQQASLQNAIARQFEFDRATQNFSNEIGLLNAKRAGQPSFGTQLGRHALGRLVDTGFDAFGSSLKALTPGGAQ